MVERVMSIQEFFKGKQIFITGGSGFIGKVLIEKLLRSCDGIENIYVLLRKKRDLQPEERLNKITDSELFDIVKQRKPEVLKKLIPIYGDIMEPNLGMSELDRERIIENVDIIYHGAASVRFDDFLKDAILLNTRGTKKVIDLALQLKHLVAFIHISTTYCNTDKQVVEEKIYPPHADWRNSIQIAEKLDQHTLDIFAPKYIEPLVNTYTFTKSLAEHVVNDLCKGKLPAIIVRPSIVISTFEDPYVGWIDNFNGPVGLLTAGGKGILKVSYGELDSRQDFITVDIVVKIMIVATYKKALSNNICEVDVYNCAGGKDLDWTNRHLVELGSKLTWDAPCAKLFWYPSFMMTNNWYIYYILFILYHMLPALLVDGVLKLAGRKPLLTKIQRRIYIANSALIYFMQNTWTFVNVKILDLTHKLLDCDKKKFSYSHCFPVSETEMYSLYIKSKIAAMRILFKEEFSMDAAFRNTTIMWILDRLLHFSIYGMACYYLIFTINIFDLLYNKLEDISNYWDNL